MMTIYMSEGDLMNKRLIMKIIAIVISVQVFSVNLFAATDEENYAGNQLKILGILKGYSDGSLQLDNNIIRSEVAALTVRILGYDDTIIVGDEKEFTDVNKDYWAFNSIQNAYKLSIIKGYPSGEFKPQSNITYAEVITIMVNALGEGSNLTGDWPDNYIDKAKLLGIISQNDTTDPGKVVTRGEMAVIVWNTLLVKR